MKSTERYIQQFDDELCRPDAKLFNKYLQLYQEDRPAFYQAGVDAWARDDLRTTICIGEIARQHGELETKLAQRLWRSYLRSGRAAEAFQLILDRRYSRRKDKVYWSDLRYAWIFLGRLEEAKDVIKAHLKVPGEALPDYDQMVLWAAMAEQELGQMAIWARARKLILAYQELELPKQAARALQAFLAGKGPLAADVREEMLTVASTLFTHLEPEEVPGLLTQIAGRFEAKTYKGKMAQEVLQLVIGGVDGPCSYGPAGETTRALRYCLAMACKAAGLHEAAIDLLSRLTLEDPRQLKFRRALAHSIGARSLRQYPVSFVNRRERKIFDVFPYNGERDMLQIKLEEMADWVDHFVIVEFKQSFTGRPKPAYLPKCKDLLEKFGHKIIHVVEEEFPPYIGAAWAREFHQRERGIVALNGLLAEDDLVLLSDADEIIDRRALETFEGDFASLRMDTFRWFLNCRRVAPGNAQPRTGSVVRGKLLARYGAALLRTVIGPHRKGDNLFNAGWHFTCIGDADKMVAKMKNSSHQEYAHLTADHYEEVILQAREGRLNGWATCGIEDLPQFVVRKRKGLASVLL